MKSPSMDAAILYVDDDRPNLDLFARSFNEHFRVLTAESAAQALEVLAVEEVGVLISDQRMPSMTGVELLATQQEQRPDITRVLLTAYSDRDLLLAAIQRGRVHDYVLKPWDDQDLELRLRQGLTRYARQRQQSQAVTERDALRDELAASRDNRLVGLDGGLRPLSDVLERVARTESTVLLRGETGTGKEVVARVLHEKSTRAGKPFIRVNCAAFSEGVLESELFGHEAGAFSGAQKARVGRFEQAHTGTLFLDEVGDLPANVQVKLLRVLQERELERVGGNRTIRVDVRVISATHRSLEEMVAQGAFREDLFFRLNVVPVKLPALRERRQDIELLARHFLQRFGAEMGKRLVFEAEAIEKLKSYDWPGNVRELKNLIERAAVLADGSGSLTTDDLLFDFWGAATASSAPVESSDGPEEAARLKVALTQAGGSKARAARILGIPRTTLNDKLRRHKIE